MTRHSSSDLPAGGGFSIVVRAQLALYPLMQVEDLYKLAHQAALGSEHAVSDALSAGDRLLRELADLVGDPVEPLMDAISPGGRMLRVHLRPFLAAGGDPERLLQAFVRTANEYKGSVNDLKRYWISIVDLAAQGQIPFHAGGLRRFIGGMEAACFPAIHHSAQYQAAYRPSYRVVVSEFLPSSWFDEPPADS